MIERRKLLGLGLGVLGASAVGPMAAFAQSKLGHLRSHRRSPSEPVDQAEGLPEEGLPAAAVAPLAAPVAQVGRPRRLPAG